MPLWTEHVETGWLAHERDALILRRDDGGRWRLDTTIDVRASLGCRVQVSGVRSGFDMLDVKAIERI